MSDLIEMCQGTCTELQRHLTLVAIAIATAEEGYVPATDAKFDETVILLEIYQDRVRAMLEALETDLSALSKLVSNNHRNP